MAAVTQLGPGGWPQQPYGSFAGKPPSVTRQYTQTFTQLGLGGWSQALYGSFARGRIFTQAFTQLGLGAWPQERYGSFAGKLPPIPPIPPIPPARTGLEKTLFVYISPESLGLTPILAARSLTQVFVGEPATLLVPVSAGTPAGSPELVITRPDGTNYEVLSTYRAFVRDREYVLYSAAVGELSLAGDWTLFYETGFFVSPTYTFRVWRP